MQIKHTHTYTTHIRRIFVENRLTENLRHLFPVHNVSSLSPRFSFNQFFYNKQTHTHTRQQKDCESMQKANNQKHFCIII